MQGLASRVAKLEKQAAGLTRQASRPDFSRYRNDPGGYARDVLGFPFVWDRIEQCALSLLTPPYRASIDSGHAVGKSHLCGWLINWWYDTRGSCAVITTAPTDKGVKEIVWTEVRLMRQRAGLPLDFIGDSAAEMRTSPEHFAKGYTARDGVSFQGRHRENMLFLFDEKEGVKGGFWQSTASMFRPGSGDAWLAVGNPLSCNTVAYQEHNATDADGNPTWHRFQLSSLDHPNIAAGLAGEPLPAPNAVTVGQVDRWIEDWTDPVAAGDEQPTDILWRGKWCRPGPIGEPRILGIRPSSGTFGIWSEALWRTVLGPEPPIPAGLLPVIGLDCASYGVDFTAWHARCGPVSLLHRSANGLTADYIAARTVLLCEELAEWATRHRGDGSRPPIPREAIAIHVDDDSEGRDLGSLLSNQGFRVVRLNAASIPQRPDLYPHVRDELWFMAARRAARGLVNLSRLDRATRQRIEMQLLAPVWWPDALGRRCVESKDDLRKPDRLGRSPDDADAVNLCFYEPASGIMSAVVPNASAAQPSYTQRARESGRSTGYGFGRR